MRNDVRPHVIEIRSAVDDAPPTPNAESLLVIENEVS
jgi:hypothetical protein